MIFDMGPMDGLVPGNILAGLCLTPGPDQFHWLIYLCESKETGTKFHAHNRMNTEHWRYECQRWDAPTSRTCVSLTKIGRLPDGMGKADMDAVLKDIPMAVPERDRTRFHSNFTCLVWFREALRRLHFATIIRLTPPPDDLDARLDQLVDTLRRKAAGIVVVRNMGRQAEVPAITRPSDLTSEVQGGTQA